MVIVPIDREEYQVAGAKKCTVCNELLGDIIYIPYYELSVKRMFFDKLNLGHTRTFCGKCVDVLTENDYHVIEDNVPFRVGSWI